MSDPILTGIKKADLSLKEVELIDYFAQGKQELGLTDQELDSVVAFVHSLGLTTKIVSTDVRRILEGSLFALGSKSDNAAWKEHVSTIREFCENWSNYTAIHNIVKRLMGKIHINEYEKIPEVDRIRIEFLCKSITNYYQYFCGFSHHRPGEIINAWRRINMSESEPGIEAYDDSNFIEIMRRYFSEMIELYFLIEKHATN